MGYLGMPSGGFERINATVWSVCMTNKVKKKKVQYHDRKKDNGE